MMTVLGRKMQGSAKFSRSLRGNQKSGAAGQQQSHHFVVAVLRCSVQSGELVHRVHGVDEGGTLCQKLLHEFVAAQHAGQVQGDRAVHQHFV